MVSGFKIAPLDNDAETPEGTLMDTTTFGHCPRCLTVPEKLFLSWYVHHLNITPPPKASTCMNQSQDWWLSPELYLRRPCELYEDYRLDRVLKRRAEAGVNVYIIVYKEVGRDLTPPRPHPTSICLPGYSDNEYVVLVDEACLGTSPPEYRRHEAS